ncbi:competence/damage-inducible protein A [Anaeromyxobacter oryzae]|uniref:Molybdenum cofactor biosynthesis protein n=1 Tax=Anaeromyxobacter oryzae TaxID=2918170 RepID=A0ABM7X456_9BACT|nr:competence/damage-inducible protein A [Anaeromyxobacter oryzae]BDG06594.1 molybdenum cofactor biosynthesis protein [Anaeromyxobacter oryzae]
MAETPTAALVVIGSEVLSAKVQDENGPYAALRLRALGVQLVGIHTVPDREEDIATSLDVLRRRVDWCFTSGGVGPTHDDITPRAVARALGRRVARSQALAESIRALHRAHHGGEEPPEAALRMADVPEGTRLLGDPGYPTLAVENVVMLPGVPRFFRHQLDAIAPLLQAPPWRLASVFVAVGEERFAPALDRVVAAHPAVEIGSYPRFDATDHRVKLTVESKELAAVQAALAALLEALPPGSVVRVEGP